MAKTFPTPGAVDVPAQVFLEFLEALKAGGASIEMIERLRQTLLEDHVFTETGLKMAVFGKEQLQ